MVADAAKDDPALDDLALVGCPAGSGTSRRLEPFRTSSIASTRSLAEDRRGRREEAQPDRSGLAPGLARRVRSQLLEVSLHDGGAAASSAALASSSSRSAGSTTMSAPARSPSSPTSSGVQEACTGPRRPRTTISFTRDDVDRVDRRVGRVRRARAPRASARASARRRARRCRSRSRPPARATRSNCSVLEVRVAVVPGDERGRRPGARQVLAGDARAGDRSARRSRRRPRRRAARARSWVTSRPTSTLPRKRKPGRWRDLLEGARDGLQVRMIRRDPEPDEPPGRRQPLDHVYLDARLVAREESPAA